MTHEEFQIRVQSISDYQLIEMADSELSKLCKTGGNSFRMAEPSQVHDTDIVFSEIIRRFKKEVQNADAQ